LTRISISAMSAAASANVAAATASAWRLGLPRRSSSRASANTPAATMAIAFGTSIVLRRAPVTSLPDRTASTKAL